MESMVYWRHLGDAPAKFLQNFKIILAIHSKI